MADESLADRLAAVERLTHLFRAERIVHLVVTMVALFLLFANAAMLIASRKAGPAELSLMFGSSGLITYSASRLLHMWNQALSIIAKRQGEEAR